MTEEIHIKAQEVKLSFPYIKNNPPSFSNAIVVNMVAKDAFTLDFGFFDPLSMQGRNESDSSSHDVDVVSRVVFTREVAETLLKQLELALNASVIKD